MQQIIRAHAHASYKPPETLVARPAIVVYPPASATDAVGPITITYSQASGTLFALGTTTVFVTATDGAGNHSDGSFTVNVRDTTPPRLTVPADQVAEATSPGGAIVVYPSASATDAVGPVTITYSQASGTMFSLGTTTVIVTAVDDAGNASQASFTVTVRDTTAPVGTLVINGDAAATGTPNVTLTLSFTDAGGPVSMRFSTDAGATWTAWEPYAATKSFTLPPPDGTKTVIAQVADAAGNVGAASDSILLVTQPPQITITPPGGGTCDLCTQYFLRYVVTTSLGIVSESAALDGKPIANGGLIDPFYLDAGTHTIVVTATDAFGHTSTVTSTFSVQPTIEGLICAVNRGVQEGVVASEQQQPLLAKLYAAQSSRDRGNVTAEANQLGAEINLLQAQDGKKIQPAFDHRMQGWTNSVISRIPPANSVALVAPAVVLVAPTTPAVNSTSTATITSGSTTVVRASAVTPIVAAPVTVKIKH